MRFFINSLVYISFFILTSCSINYNWYKFAEPSSTIVYVKVQDSDVFCTKLGVKKDTFLHHIYACARYKPHLCIIYSEYEEENIPMWLKEHEELHCNGWKHD